MHRYEFELSISPDEFLEYYRGGVRHAVGVSRSGQRVQFPASLLQRFITPDGIRGTFVLTCDENHKNPRLEKLH
ncbi:MAG TPA: DUF2835 domain-containing protein [Verrucomicrobiae bacterium]|nr:DUF2835 domain-containing protein [Verrucomicrobiae bacterium]